MKRLDLKVGFSCNNNCTFCAQAHRRDQGDNSFDEIVKDLEEGYEDGVREVVFTGGEPTIREDIVEIITRAKEIGFKNIQIQTNGRMFYYKDFAKKLIDAGATEFSPALHGPDKETHEKGTRADGSFEQTLQGIKNLKDIGAYVITNTVVNKFNYKKLPEIVEILMDIGVDQFQLAFVHPCGNAGKNFYKVVPRKSDAQPYIHEALDLADDHPHDTKNKMVEAYPYCFMQGYEQYVSQLYMPKADIRGQGNVVKDHEKLRVSHDKMKAEKCKKCKYFKVCEGPWKEYPQHYGFEEFEPVPGEKLETKEEVLEEHGVEET